ncbi:hypothetical protein V8E36_008037 [Tilletia maclaganii]
MPAVRRNVSWRVAHSNPSADAIGMPDVDHLLQTTSEHVVEKEGVCAAMSSGSKGNGDALGGRGGDGVDTHVEAQASVSSLRSRFEQMGASISNQQPLPRPVHRNPSNFSTASTSSVSRISLTDVGPALAWADSGGASATTPPASASDSSPAGLALPPPPVPRRPSEGPSTTTQSTPGVPPRPSPSGTGAQQAPRRSPPAPPRPTTVKPPTRQDTITPSASSHAIDGNYLSSTSPAASATPISIPQASPTHIGPTSYSAPNANASHLSIRNTLPPPLLRSQHSRNANTNSNTGASSLQPPQSQWAPTTSSPTSSTFNSSDEEEDLFSASDEDDDSNAGPKHSADGNLTSPELDGTTSRVKFGRRPTAPPTSGRAARKAHRSGSKSIGAKALGSAVSATGTFLSRSLSARVPSGHLTPNPSSASGSASNSRPDSSGGTGLSRGPSSPNTTAATPAVEQLPDATHVNRRPPAYSPARSAIARSEFVDFDVCGSTLVTATHDGKVKVYHLPPASANTSRTGQSLDPGARTSSKHAALGPGAEKVCEIEIRAAKNGVEGSGAREKITAIQFRCPAPSPTHAAARRTMGRFVWVATKEGAIYEVDLSEARVVDSKTHLHACAVILLERVGDKMIALDEGGKISTWVPPQASSSSPSLGVELGEGSQQGYVTLQTRPSTQRIAMEKHACPLILGDQLWVCWGPGSASHHVAMQAGQSSSSSSTTASSSAAMASLRSNIGLKIAIYNPPFVENRNFSAVSRPVSLPRDMPSANVVGPVCSGATIPGRPGLVYLGHESGHVSVWSKSTSSCVAIQRLGRRSVVAMAGVVRFLWVGTRAGEICVYDPDTEDSPNWRLLKKWVAHKDPVLKLLVDRTAAGSGVDVPQLQVGSGGEDGCVHFWDGTLQVDWLDKAVLCREAEFCTFRPLRCWITTFNIDAASPTEFQRDGVSENLNFLESLITTATRESKADVLVFGFQELIDLEKKSLTAKTLLVGKKRFADHMGAKVSANYAEWHEAISRAVLIYASPTEPYQLIASDSLVGLFTLVFVRRAELGHIRDAATGVTRVGLGGRYGNKGAIATRFVIDDTSVSFVNCHLSAGQRAVKRRNQDVADILEDTDVFAQTVENTDAFVPGGDGRMILDHTLCFLSGDLNYRIDQHRDTTISLIKQRQLDVLLSLDQLRTQMATNPTCRLRYFTEAYPLNFIPTYKYDKGTHDWDTSNKQRIPAWCDRILWREQGADWSRGQKKRMPPPSPSVISVDADGSSSQEPKHDDTMQRPIASKNPQHVPAPPPPLATSLPVQGLGSGHVRVLSYRRWEPTISDHRPVTGLFEIQVRRVNNDLKEAVLAQLREEWTGFEDEMVGIANSQWWL